MSWIQKLVETYDNCQGNVGYSGQEKQRPLLPVCHITTQAHVEIVINGDGNFLRARLITDKADSVTIIPCTEGSGSRAGSKPENHPLCDKLQYVAGDFSEFGGNVTSGFSKNPCEPFQNYISSLSNWCNSEFNHPKIQAIWNYVKKKRVIKDLVNQKIILLDSEEKFADKEKVERKKNTKDIFSVVDPQDNMFIRWIVEIPGDNESEVWKDKSVWNSWINYYISNKNEEALCYVTGEKQVVTNNHPKYIRREGDGAKLISANDSSGFTFRGRFLKGSDACSVGLIPSNKAHYALAWLISRQGYVKGDLAIVAWATNGKSIPSPTDDVISILGFDDLLNDEKLQTYTAQDLAIQFKKRIAGYGKDIDNTTDIVIIGLDSATTGRASIIFYRNLSGSDFLDRVNEWHESCSWLHTYRSIEISDESTGRRKKVTMPFIGAPAPADISEALYGTRIDDKLRNATINRILPCIIDGHQIPRDMVETAVRRASSRSGKDYWEWNKTLSIACSLYKKYYRKENYTMALDLNRNTRDYLYGRLLALAESLEEWSLQESNEKRETNAARLMQRFSERPYSTWLTIELSLTPYKSKLGGKSKKRQRLIDEVVSRFEANDFLSDKKLSGEFLLGYHCQREFLRNQSIQNQLNQEEEISELEA